MISPDMDKVIKYKQAHARQLSAQAEMAEIWETMTPEQRRLATSVAAWSERFNTLRNTAGQ